MLNLLVIIFLSYLVGSIPSGIIVSKWIKGIDIRQHGSGNTGGTNVFRTLGWQFGIVVILMDAIKGALVVIVVARLYLGNFPFPNATPFDDFTLVQIIAVRENIFGVDIRGYHTILPFAIALAVLVIYTHRSNLVRLFKGNENQFSLRKKKK
jgi:glycerol-3-phosphate acyltransferase PlsY